MNVRFSIIPSNAAIFSHLPYLSLHASVLLEHHKAIHSYNENVNLYNGSIVFDKYKLLYKLTISL
jgi:hypothetical protein